MQPSQDRDPVEYEEVGQQNRRQGENTSGVKGFIGMSIAVWALVVLLAVVFVGVILVFAL